MNSLKATVLCLTIAASASGCKAPASHPSSARDAATAAAFTIAVDAGNPLLALIASLPERFSAGIRPLDLPVLFPSMALKRFSDTSWTAERSSAGFSVSVMSEAETKPATRIRLSFDDPPSLQLRDLEGVLGASKSLPPGEYTWVRFERASQKVPDVGVSAMVGTGKAAAQAPVLVFQVQRRAHGD